MIFITSLLLVAQAILSLFVIFSAWRSACVFSLRSILSLALLFYFTLPIGVAASSSDVMVNGALLPVYEDSLLISALISFLFAAGIAALPSKSSYARGPSPGWLNALFFFLFAVNTASLIGFARTINFDVAAMLLGSGTGSRYRDLSYQALVDSDTGMGYVPKALQIAVFACLWRYRAFRARTLIFCISPVILLDVISLGRHVIASFLLVAFCLTEELAKRSTTRLLYIIAPTLILAVFFLRIFVFSATDIAYESWIETAFSPESGGLEIVGEFFNTYGTFLMLSSMGDMSFTFSEITDLFMSQVVLPPGISGWWYDFTQGQFPLFRVTEQIVANYGPHPAHSSLVDVFTFGLVAIFGPIIYLSSARAASSGASPLMDVMYYYLLAMFYLPYRGSLVLNGARLIWLMFFILIFRFAWIFFTSRRRLT